MALSLLRARDEIIVLLEQSGISATKIPSELVNKMLNYSYSDVVDRLELLEREFTTVSIVNDDDPAIIEDTYKLDATMEKPNLVFLNDVEAVPVGYQDLERLKIEAESD